MKSLALYGPANPVRPSKPDILGVALSLVNKVTNKHKCSPHPQSAFSPFLTYHLRPQTDPYNELTAVP